jgi:hypothetical protein
MPGKRSNDAHPSGTLGRRKTLAGAVAASLAAILLFVTAAYAGTPTVVLDQPKLNEFSITASPGYLGWSQNSAAHPRHYNAFAKPTDGARFRLNAHGTRGFTTALDGTTAIFQQAAHGHSVLKLFDLIGMTREDPPDGVNTPYWEMEPSLSGDQILFTRTNIGQVPRKHEAVRVILFDMTAGTGQVLAEVAARGHYLVSNQVNGDYATWESCGKESGEFVNCNVFRYKISTEATVKIPNPDKQQYASSVSADGTLYFERAGRSDHWQCGLNPTLYRYPIGGPAVAIAELPDGKDVFTTFSFMEEDLSTTLYFDRVTCRTGLEGLYKVSAADTTTLPG